MPRRKRRYGVRWSKPSQHQFQIPKGLDTQQLDYFWWLRGQALQLGIFL